MLPDIQSLQRGRTEPQMEDEKLSGRVIIDTILANMRQQVEELRYSKIVPAAYDVYLHGEDQQRFEGLAHEIAAEAVRALQEALDAFNRPSRLDRMREIVKKPRLPYKKVGPWLVRIARDPDDAVPRGRALVVSQIALAGADSFEGQRTRRLATLSEGRDGRTESADRDVRMPGPSWTPEAPRSRPDRPSADPRAAEGRFTAPQAIAESRSPSDPQATPSDTAEVAPPAPAALAENDDAELEDTREVARSRALATLSWEDEAGPHAFRMTGLELTVGRAVQGSTADVRLETLPDVSRTHLRVRYHPEDRSFSIEDLSLLGTSVNGEPLERGAPRPLPERADIRLADHVTLRFESEAQS
jgi:hypothetical protein